MLTLMNAPRWQLSPKTMPWLLFAVVVTVPSVAWLQTYNWEPVLTISAVFPLLGVLAWSIMWTHYAYSWMRLHYPEAYSANALYDKVSTWLVLGLILLHPGLLGWQQYRLFGVLPPDSFYTGIAENLEPFVAIGALALVLFLIYEVVHRLRQKQSIQKIWGWISLSQLLAMVLIFVHGLQVGQIVLSGWMIGWWIILGVLLLPALYSTAINDWKVQQQASKIHP